MAGPHSLGMPHAAHGLTARGSGRDLATLISLNAGALRALELLLHEQVDAFEPEVKELAEYCLGSSGKRLRPLLVFLSGWEGEGKVNQDLVRAAAVIEMVHIATLVHDDIMDGASLRRGRETISERDGPSVAVLLGDALFAQAVVLSTRFQGTLVCRRVAEATRRVCSGEIIQTLSAAGGPPDRARYERVIDLKTAELFSVSCELGAALTEADDTRIQAAAAFGRHLGVAYQIYDDLTDFAGSSDATGKTLGTDWESGKFTLPVFELLERMPSGASQGVLEALGSGDQTRLAEVTSTMRERGVFQAVLARIHSEIDSAKAELARYARNGGDTPLLDLCNALEAQAAALGCGSGGLSG